MNHTTHLSIQQFTQLVELKDYRPPTKKEYVRMIRRLADHFACDPASLSENQIREYFLFLRQVKKFGRSAMTIAKAAWRCFFCEQLKVAGWTVFSELRIACPQVLPVVLSRQEVARGLGVVREARFSVCLRLIYHCGLRVGEAVAVAVHDIHGRENPPRLHVCQGKGGQERFVPLTLDMVAELRAFWKMHRHPRWLFPAPGRAWAERGTALVERMSQASAPMSVSAVQNSFRLARAQSGVNAQSTVHTLRHSYATHLLEEGVSLRQISQYLGHHSLDTAVIYTHLTAISEARTQAALQTLYRQL
ncbi:MAG: tyrosine-type recombinase/integrase, partial [Anaerolineales bacterium]